jgi:phenylacetic acid degradation protein
MSTNFVAHIYEIDGMIPVIHPTAYVHPTAVVIGDVIIGAGVYVGPCACLRGDFGRLIIEENANVQDTCVMHGFPESDTIVHAHGHIGHGAVLHGCTIGRNALVGMNAVVMDFANVGEESIIGASAFVKAKMVIPRRSLVMGAPAKIVREVSDEEIAWKSKGTQTYIELTRRCAATMKPVAALPSPEPNRKRIAFRDAVRPLSVTKNESNS